MNLTKAQLNIAHTTDSKVVVVASAASGKTATLVARAQYLLDSGVKPTSIVVITFTNAAAEELSIRLNRPKGTFIGTIHSYANYLLRSYGVDTSNILNDEDFDMLFPLIKQNPNCVLPVEHLLLDEAQDSTPEQFEFLIDMVKPKNYMLVGDHRQSIYRWRNATPDYIINLMHDPSVTVYSLDENFRNGSKILEFAKSIIRQAGYEYQDYSEPMRNTTGTVVNVELSPVAIARTIKKRGDYKNWFILARTNDQVDEMMWFLEKEGVPCASFKRAQLTNKELYEKLQEDNVKVLTIHTSKGLEANNVVVIGARFYNLEEKCVSYVAATRARDLLVWTNMVTKPKKARQISSWER